MPVFPLTRGVPLGSGGRGWRARSRSSPTRGRTLRSRCILRIVTDIHREKMRQIPMIIDCHGHYTTAPRQHEGWRNEQIEAHKAGKSPPPRPRMTDDEIRETIVGGQLKVQRERGTDLTIFSPRAAGMGHHLGSAATSEAWAPACNELIHRVCTLFPKNFIGAGMLPQSPG